MAGPVVAAAVVLPAGACAPPAEPPDGRSADALPEFWSSLRDSKAMTKRERAALAPLVERGAAGW
ncbi:MAG: hypothetical protein U0470_05435, partial [Anaerolineae bacterium]